MFTFNNNTYKTLAEALLAYWDAPDDKKHLKIYDETHKQYIKVPDNIWRKQ